MITKLSKRLDSQSILNLSGILVSLLVSGLAIANESATGNWVTVAVIAAAFIASFIVFLTSNTYSNTVRAFWAQAGLIVLFFFSTSASFAAIFSVVWIVQAAELYGSKRSSYFLAAGLLVFLLSRLYHSGLEGLPIALVSCVLYGLLQVFALSSILRSIREKELRESTAALNRELIATRTLLAQSSAQSERVRIARDLHDILGHHMTALILNLEVAKHTVQNRATEPNQAADKVEQALALAKLLLGDIRSAVSELRDDDEIELTPAIESLTYDIPEIDFVLNIDDALQINDVSTAQTLLRCIQESITNVVRHSVATKCEISLSANDGSINLVIKDNGNGCEHIVPGNGLTGMSERIREKNGELHWSSTEEGFTVSASLELEAST